MKRHLCLLLLLALLLAGCDGGLYSGTLIFEGEHSFGPGTQLPGDVFVRAGTAEFGAGSQVAGSIYMLGGSLTVNGTIGGDLALLGGSLVLGPQAVVDGDLRLGGGEVAGVETAVIHGDIINGSGVEIPASVMAQRQSWDDCLRALSAALLLAGLGALLVRSRPQPVIRMGAAVVDNSLVSSAMGLLILLVLPALLVMMAFTIILIPLVVILGMLLLLLLGYGWVAVGHQLGMWLNRRLNQGLSTAVATFGGTLLLLLLFEIPYLGDGLLAVTAVLVLGAVFLTRLGTQPYIPDTFKDEPPDLSSYARQKR
ncbi:MAG: hypothetical protein H6667_08380 [Ardenticatenaceae bacterium]|nr:hypothetical protein [Ardenticatenaceae bacterium]